MTLVIRDFLNEKFYFIKNDIYITFMNRQIESQVKLRTVTKVQSISIRSYKDPHG